MSGSGPPAFILGLDENGYGILRSLARMGVPSFGFYNTPKSFGRFSRLCKAFQLGYPAAAVEEICRALVEKRKGFAERPVIFPTSDAFVNLIQSHRALFGEHFRYHWVSSEQHRRILDKGLMGEACEAAGVRVPQTYVTRPGEEINEAGEGFPFPCLIKPCRSFDTYFPQDVKNVIARGPAELRDFYVRHPDTLGETLWQEIIEGADDDIYQCTVLIRLNGEPGAVFCTRKLRQYLPGFGIMCFGRSEENPVVVSHALKLLRALEWQGIASLEFKRRRRDNEYYFIEMYPRLPWYNSLFIDAGVNLAYLAYQDLTGGGLFDGSEVRQRDGVHWLALREDLGWFVRIRGVRPFSTVRWFASLTEAQSYAWWNLRDPNPWIHALWHLLRLSLRRDIP